MPTPNDDEDDEDDDFKYITHMCLQDGGARFYGMNIGQDVTAIWSNGPDSGHI